MCFRDNRWHVDKHCVPGRDDLVCLRVNNLQLYIKFHDVLGFLILLYKVAPVHYKLGDVGAFLHILEKMEEFLGAIVSIS